jgi:hypothetical protein
MASVIEDIGAAQALFAGEPQNNTFSVQAYHARQRVKKTGFADIRSACVRLGSGLMTTPFLRLDKEIDDFAAQWTTKPTAGDPQRIGANASLLDQLHQIYLQAASLRDDAAEGVRRCTAVLAETPTLADFP